MYTCTQNQLYVQYSTHVHKTSYGVQYTVHMYTKLVIADHDEGAVPASPGPPDHPEHKHGRARSIRECPPLLGD